MDTKTPVSGFVQTTSIHAKILRQSVLLVTFCILLLGGLSFFVVTSYVTDIQMYPGWIPTDLPSIGATLLVLSALLIILAILLSTLLARGLTRSLRELSDKVHELKPGVWNFRQSLRTGDEVESLDRVIADIAGRLQCSYEHLEDLVAERTKKLEEEFALDRAILESIAYGIVTFDQSGRITGANPAACSVLQRSQEELTGKDAADTLPLLQRKSLPLSAEHPIRSVLRTRKPYRSHPSVHMSLARTDGSAMPITLLVLPLLQGDHLFGGIAVTEDMSVERQIDYMKSEFISLASHQLRTPLSSIRWYLEMLQTNKTTMNDEQRTYVDEIAAASGRMAALIEALLHVARLEGGAMAPTKENVDTFVMLRRLTHEWQQTAEEQSIPLAITLPHRALSVCTDPVLLQIVLQNLFNNAVKYSPKKTPIRFSAMEQPGALVFTMEDSGLGIPIAEQKHLFQKFFRAKNVRKLDTDGTGLGLYMSKSIIENLGGELSFESTEGKGSTFTVRLPV